MMLRGSWSDLGLESPEFTLDGNGMYSHTWYRDKSDQVTLLLLPTLAETDGDVEPIITSEEAGANH